MVILLKAGSSSSEIAELEKYLSINNTKYQIISSENIGIIYIIEGSYLIDQRVIEDFSAVLKAVRITGFPPKVVGEKPDLPRRIRIGNTIVGDGNLTIIAGPCSVENRENFRSIADQVVKDGAHILRGGAFKPRTSPYSFQGLGEEGLTVMRETADELGVQFVTEVMSLEQIELVDKYADAFQIGMRSMRNYPLLKEIGTTDKPIILKRATDAALDEWLLSAEYILTGGNEQLIFCERGISTQIAKPTVVIDFKTALEAKNLTGFPVIIDPSHGAATRDMVPPLARAAIAAGLDGVMIEVHSNPHYALSDGFQSLYPQDFRLLVKQLVSIKKEITGQN